MDAPQLVVVYPWNSVPGAGAGTLSPSTPGPVSGPAGAPLRLPGGERRRPPHLRLHKHYHSSPIKTNSILLTHPPFHSLTGRPRHREHPGQAWPRPRAALGTPGERRTPARVCPHVHASHHARGPKGPGSTIRIRARSHPTTASQPWDHTGQARPVMPKAQPTPLPKDHSPGRRRKALCQAQAPAGKEPSDHAQS